jgi:hypothetical protein
MLWELLHQDRPRHGVQINTNTETIFWIGSWPLTFGSFWKNCAAHMMKDKTTVLEINDTIWELPPLVSSSVVAFDEPAHEKQLKNDANVFVAPRANSSLQENKVGNWKHRLTNFLPSLWVLIWIDESMGRAFTWYL